MLTISNISNTTFHNPTVKNKKHGSSFDSDKHSFKSVSFSGATQFNDIQIQNMKRSKNVLGEEISKTFKTDRMILNDDFTGELNDENKFSKFGYYIYKKESESSDLFKYLQTQNPRQLHKDYESFYNSNLKSHNAVLSNNKKYLDDSLNAKIQKNNEIDKLLEQELDNHFLSKQKSTKQEIVPDKSYLNTEYAQKQLNFFKSAIKENPILMTEENLKTFFNVVNKQLDKADKSEYNLIYEDLDNLSEGLYENNKNLLESSWKKLTNQAVSFFKEDLLKEIVENKDKKVGKLNDFLESKNYQILNRNNNLDLLFSYRGSGELSLSEKTFLIDKYQKAESEKKSYGIDMLDFLVNKPANNKIRKQIVKNLVESEEFANENFSELKTLFIHDVNNKNIDSTVSNIKIGNKNIADKLLEGLDVEILNMSKSDKINYLSKIADEDLEKLIEKMRTEWMDEKFTGALNLESEKYDTAKQSENILNHLTLDVDGKSVGIYEFVDDSFKKLYGQNFDLKQISEKTLDEVILGNNFLVEHDRLNSKQYDSLMNQMTSIITTLCKHDAKSDKFHQEISMALDKLEMENPGKSENIKDARSFVSKLFSGILNPGSLMSGMYMSSIVDAACCSGEPFTMTLAMMIKLGVLSYNIFHNVKNEFKKG